jgi:hypothetical protein
MASYQRRCGIEAAWPLGPPAHLAKAQPGLPIEASRQPAPAIALTSSIGSSERQAFLATALLLSFFLSLFISSK